MQPDNTTSPKLRSNELMDVLISFGLIAFVVVMSARVFAPFAGLMLWSLILAVALYPLHQRLTQRLGGRPGRSATVLVVAGLLLIGVPTAMIGDSFANHLHGAYTAFESNEISIKQPDPSVAEWPLVGKKIYSAWGSAAKDLPAYLNKNKAQFKQLSRQVLSAAASTASAVMLFLGAMIIAGIMMAYGESGSQAMQRIITRISGPIKGPRLHTLSTATVRSVAMGVIGVAAIQALLLGIGFVWAGIPGAGVLALIVLVFGILQLPGALVSLPAIAYLWMSGDASTTSNIVFTIYLLVAGMADNVLKPLLLGRGVDAPMPIVLIGALGGMVSAGIIGLFVGAVLLAVGYQVFMEWVGEPEEGAPAAPSLPEAVVAEPTGGE